jgi:hypothetical protein
MANIEAKSREEWLKLASSSDAVQRKQVTEALRTLGLQSAEFMPMDAQARVDYIMSKQGDVGSGGGTKTESKKDAATPPSGKAEGGGGMSAADRALLKSINEKLDENKALLSKVHDLLVVQIFTDPKVKSNAEDMDVKVALLGNG